jgi:drug/metabolite transporter (DMT)-like permease
MKFRNSYHPFALITIIFWALSYVLTRLSLQHFSAFSLGVLRYIVASATLLVVALINKMPLPKKKDLPWFILAGTLGFFIYVIAFNIGTSYVSASTSSILIAASPIITALIANRLYKEKLAVFQWVAILIEFAGVLILTLINGIFSVNSGISWLILAAISFSFYNLLQRRLTRTYSALQVSSFSMFFGTLMLLIFFPASIGEIKAADTIFLYHHFGRVFKRARVPVVGQGL